MLSPIWKLRHRSMSTQPVPSHGVATWQQNQDHTLTTPTSFSTVYPHSICIYHFNFSKNDSDVEKYNSLKTEPWFTKINPSFTIVYTTTPGWMKSHNNMATPKICATHTTKVCWQKPVPSRSAGTFWTVTFSSTQYILRHKYTFSVICRLLMQ